MDIRIRDAEEADDQPFLLWDTVVVASDPTSEVYMDWKLAGPNAKGNVNGLAADHGLHTAITLSLFTWRRAEPYDDLPSGADPQGWWGDTLDLEDNEAKLGSRLWLLQRAPLNAETGRRAEDYALEALQPLVDQEAVSRFECSASMDIVKGLLGLQVSAFSQSGQLIYNQKFERLWRQEFP